MKLVTKLGKVHKLKLTSCYSNMALQIYRGVIPCIMFIYGAMIQSSQPGWFHVEAYIYVLGL